MRSNTHVQVAPAFTHEGTRASQVDTVTQLRRSVMACMLWEGNFYESGQEISERIKSLAFAVTPEVLAGMALYARTRMKLRHVPLMLANLLAFHPKRAERPDLVRETIRDVIQRADELAEFLSLYFGDKKHPLSAQVKRGLAMAFTKFNAYELAKYNRDYKVKLRDVMFLCHAKPADVAADAARWNKAARAAYNPEAGFSRAFTDGEILFGQVVNDALPTPDTWETGLSAGDDKRETFIRLMAEGKLGDLAFLRNLRNMIQAGIDLPLIVAYGDTCKWGRVLPFRFIAAASIVPQIEPHIERWMIRCLAGMPKLTGKTAVVIDTSPSMWQDKISAKSDMTRFDAAAALAILVRELSADSAVYAFNERGYVVPARHGFALRDALAATRGNASCGGLAVKMANLAGYDRIIVLTDGQWHEDDGTSYVRNGGMTPAKSVIPNARTDKAYLIDVSGNKNGIGYGKWNVIEGFSEAVIDFIVESESDHG